MAISFAASLALPPPISPFSFKPNPLPSHSTPFLLRKPSFIIAVASAKNRRRESSTAVVMDSSDVDAEDEDDEDEGEDEEFVAFKYMRRWEMNKPAGFGEGKVYDTTVEEQLLEERERERAAQVAAGKKKEVKSDSWSGKKQEKRMLFQVDLPCDWETSQRKRTYTEICWSSLKGLMVLLTLGQQFLEIGRPEILSAKALHLLNLCLRRLLSGLLTHTQSKIFFLVKCRRKFLVISYSLNDQLTALRH